MKASVKARSAAACVVASLFLFGCGSGEGIDAKLASESEAAYRTSLNKAWLKMSAEEQSSYNWAVNNLSLDMFLVKYPNATPREVINRQADEYIKAVSERIATTTAEYAQQKKTLDEQEAILAQVDAELGKITASSIAIVRGTSFGDPEIRYTVTNNSRFNVSKAYLDAWVFVDGEQKSSRSCRVFGYFKSDGGLSAGKTLSTRHSLFSGCDAWKTLEVKNAKQLQYQMEIDKASVEDFGERKIRPTYSPTRADYEKQLKQDAENVAAVVKLKADLKK
ncbi:hypothetical protein HEAR0609 [Herminiimonas arsenicoxydans]|uniref:Lipoprotein n=1 Tax=Herminiimonas arsenicoxydans TaxID=204773 RepID=A4G2S2_HERAR|nr:hypothetical protein HEAR0609 [Herminiimonas arsenicoxydans]